MSSRGGAPTIAVLGGGVYVPRLCGLLRAAAPTSAGSVRLFARRLDRLQTIAHACAARLARDERGPGWTVDATASLEAAVDGADAVVVLVRVGGNRARAHDEEFPRRFGLVGDEGLGPGGFANAYRSLPFLAHMAAVIRRLSPRASVWNLVAPLGITTRLLLEEGLNAIGVCELPQVTLDGLIKRVSSGARTVFYRYFGLNHVGWFWNVVADGVDVLERAAELNIVDRATWEAFGAAPLRYFYEVFDLEAAARLGLSRKPGRAAALEQLAEVMLSSLSSEGPYDVGSELRPTPWFDQALVPVLSAVLADRRYEGFLNVGNALAAGGGRCAAFLSPESVVESHTILDPTTGILPDAAAAASAPVAVQRFLQRIAAAESLAYEAARERSESRFAEAVAALPLRLGRARLPELVKSALRDTSPEREAEVTP